MTDPKDLYLNTLRIEREAIGLATAQALTEIRNNLYRYERVFATPADRVFATPADRVFALRAAFSAFGRLIAADARGTHNADLIALSGTLFKTAEPQSVASLTKKLQDAARELADFEAFEDEEDEEDEDSDKDSDDPTPAPQLTPVRYGIFVKPSGSGSPHPFDRSVSFPDTYLTEANAKTALQYGSAADSHPLPRDCYEVLKIED